MVFPRAIWHKSALVYVERLQICKPFEKFTGAYQLSQIALENRWLPIPITNMFVEYINILLLHSDSIKETEDVNHDKKWKKKWKKV